MATEIGQQQELLSTEEVFGQEASTEEVFEQQVEQPQSEGTTQDLFELPNVGRQLMDPEDQTTEELFGEDKPDRQGWNWADIPEAYRRGDRSFQLDMAGFDAATGLKSYDDVKRMQDEFETYAQNNPLSTRQSGLFGRAVIGATQITPGLLEGTKSGLLGGISAAGAALAAGQIPPLTFAPEEAISLPGAFSAGFASGSTIEWWKQGTGQFYMDMREMGVNHPIASIVAQTAGLPYALVEQSQLTKLIPGMKKAITQFIPRTGVQVAKRMAARYGKNWFEQMSQEMAQEAIAITAEELGRGIQEFATGHNLPYADKYGGWFERIMNTAVEAGLAFSLLQIPGIAAEGTAEMRAAAKIKEQELTKSLEDEVLSEKLTPEQKAEGERVRRWKSLAEMKRRGLVDVEEVRQGFGAMTQVEREVKVRVADGVPEDAEYVDTVKRDDGSTLEFYKVSITKSQKEFTPKPVRAGEPTEQQKKLGLLGTPGFEVYDPAIPGILNKTAITDPTKDIDPNTGVRPPRVMYRGDAYAWTVYDTEKLDPFALYGPGFYFSSDPEVASEYTTKLESNVTEKSFESKEEAIEFEEYVKAKQGDLYGKLSQNKEGKWLVVYSLPQAEFGPNVKAAHLDIRNPFMAYKDDFYKGKELKDIVNAAKEHGVDISRLKDKDTDKDAISGEQLLEILHDAVIEKVQTEMVKKTGGQGIDENFFDMVAEEAAWRFQDLLKDMGYDGIVHTGGRLMGSVEHEVAIAFDPEQIISVWDPRVMKPEINPTIQPFRFTKDRVNRLQQSVTKDAEGRPIRLYHGTPYAFTGDIAIRGKEEIGYFATDDPDLAAQYAEKGGDPEVFVTDPVQNVRPVYYILKNPLKLDEKPSDEFLDGINQYFEPITGKNIREVVVELEEQLDTVFNVKDVLDVVGIRMHKNIRNKSRGDIVRTVLKKMGYDGTVRPHPYYLSTSEEGIRGITGVGMEYSVFDLHQIIPALGVEIQEGWIHEGEETFFTVDRSKGENTYGKYFEMLEDLPTTSRINKKLRPVTPDQVRKPTMDELILSHAMQRYQNTKDYDAKNPILSQDFRIATEEAFNSLPLSIKEWNRLFDNIEAHGYKPGYMDTFKTLVQDTALLWTKMFGKAGGRAMQMAIEGYDRYVEFSKGDKVVLDRASNAAKDIEARDGIVELNAAFDRIVAALQDRPNARHYLRSEEEISIYESLQVGYDRWRQVLEDNGIPTIDDYFTRVLRDANLIEAISESSLEGLLSGNEKTRNVSRAALNDALQGKVDSGFLRQRRGDMQRYSRNPIQVYSLYANSVGKAIAYKPFMLYYMNQFGQDIPGYLRIHKDFPKAKQEFANWIRNFVRPEYMYGSFGSKVTYFRRWIYRNILNFNIGAALDNTTQKDFGKAFTSPVNWPIANSIYKNRRNLASDMPNLHKIITLASKDKAFMMEMTKQEMFPDSPKIDPNILQRFLAKLDEVEPFQGFERSNWDYSEIMGVVEMVMQSKLYKDMEANDPNFDPVLGIEKALRESSELMLRSLINAQSLSQQTQLMPGYVGSPKYFRSTIGRVLGMFTRFPFGQIENMVLSFRTSGANGAAALRILRRGFSDEAVPAEKLQEMATFRAAIGDLIRSKKKNYKNVDLPLPFLNRIHDQMKEFEDDMARVVNQLQPIGRIEEGKQVKRSQIALWAKHIGKRVGYAFMWNVFANIAIDALGIGISDEWKKVDPIERAWRSAWINIVPFYWEVANPNAMFATPLLPDFTAGGFGVSRRTFAKGLARWGFNLVPGLGMVDRITGRVISTNLVDVIAPVEKKEGKIIKF